MRAYADACIEHAADAETPNDLYVLNGAARAIAGDPSVLTAVLGRLDAGQYADGQIDL